MENFDKDALKDALGGNRCALAVDTAALRENAKYLIGKTAKKLIAVVKANAYGLGLDAVTTALAGLCPLFAVATAGEALAVAAKGLAALVMSPVSAKEAEELSGKGIAVSVSCEEDAALAAAHGLPAHIAVDTGMRRYGSDWHDIGRLLRICDTDGLDVKGIYTHFCTADEEDTAFAREQNARFERVVSVVGKVRFGYIHSAASAAVLRLPATGNAIRPGLALYGVNPPFCHAPLNETSRLYARVLCTHILRDGESIGYGAAYTASGNKRIAVIGAGYGDGLPYFSKNQLFVSINGFICPIVGRVCMDCAFVDVTHARVEDGDYALVLGGDGETSFAAVARKTGGLPYTVMTGISERVPRVYL